MTEPIRSEAWTRDGRTAHVEVEDRHGLEVVPMTYELFAKLLTELGFTKAEAKAEDQP